MSDLLGIWSYRGSQPTQLVGTERLLAMQAQLSGNRLSEFADGPIWMTARSGCLRSEAGQCAAYEGFLARDDWCATSIGCAMDLSGSTSQWRDFPDGQFSVAWVHPANGELRLLRGLSGGERLYTLEAEELFLFATSIRPLLAFLGDNRRFNDTKTRTLLLAGIDLGRQHGAIEGVEEVRPGELLTLSSSTRSTIWFYGDLLKSPQGDLQQLARNYRERLTEAVYMAAGSSRPVAVTLSGGIDSSAIAAAAVDAFGADQVHAFTYEFKDPGHPSETPYARDVCTKLGIRNHHVFPISFEAFLAAIPETVWRAESFVHWPKAFMIPVTQTLRDAGFDRQLSGFGIGSHMAYFKDLAFLQDFLPQAGFWLRAWAFLRRWRLPLSEWLSKLHPGLELPNGRLMELFREVLDGDSPRTPRTNLYPKWLGELLCDLPMDESAGNEYADLPPDERMARLAFVHLVSCVDVTRWEKVTRELGCHRMSPAHFASCLPYAYLPYDPQLPLWDPERRARPGKHLLRIALRKELPDSVLYRKKSWADAVISPLWLQAGARWMRQAIPNYPRDALGELTPQLAPPQLEQVLKRLDQQSPQMTVTALAFWRQLFLHRSPTATPPAWNDLHSPAPAN